MWRIIPYTVFLLAYAGLQFFAHLAVEGLGFGAQAERYWWLVPLAIAPLAVLIAKRTGEITPRGIATASTALVLFLFLCMAVILFYLSRSSGSSQSLSDFMNNFGDALIASPSQLVSTVAVLVLAPCAWTLLFNGRARKTSPSAP